MKFNLGLLADFFDGRKVWLRIRFPAPSDYSRVPASYSTRYSRSFLLEEFWALTLILFAFALGLSSLIGLVEQRVEYYAGSRE